MHHIREMVAGDTDPRLRVKFTPSQMNFADPMTKNVTESIHKDLVPAIKNGQIARVIFDTARREDVGNHGGLKGSNIPKHSTLVVLPGQSYNGKGHLGKPQTSEKEQTGNVIEQDKGVY
jgi:hypothetical protein